MMTVTRTALIAVLLATTAMAAAPRGPVHSEKAAILMARRIWISLYPKSAAKAGSEKAWLSEESATVDGNLWEVGPKKPSATALGSGLTYRINSDDGHLVGYFNPNPQ